MRVKKIYNTERQLSQPKKQKTRKSSEKRRDSVGNLESANRTNESEIESMGGGIMRTMSVRVEIKDRPKRSVKVV